ncbi:MAG: DMT family transporter [Pleurocapsa sp. MO_226.B13]|nr:DMT family transporter [Pleurocapsa sp. MO_226.B13]
MQKFTTIYIKLVLTMAIWGGTFVVGRIVAQNLDPFTAGLGRFASASIFLWFLIRSRKEKLARLNLRQILLVILLGLSGILTYNLCFFLGLKEISASRAGLIIALNPICITIGSRIFFQERLTLLKLVGIAISLLGAALIITEGNISSIVTEGIGKGELFILGCVFSWVCYSLLGKLAMQELSALTTTTYAIWLGTLFLIPVTIWENDRLPTIDFSTALGLLYLGIVATVIAFNWYYAGIKEIGASKAAIFINLVPMFAIIFGLVFLQESLSAIAFLGGGLVILGVFLVNR